MVVQAASDERVEALDAHLWTYRDDAFLAHGTYRESEAAQQPVLLTVQDDNPNGATVRFLIDGAPVPEDAAKYQRIVLLFDGEDDDAVAAARERWTALKAQGFDATYWQADEQRPLAEEGLNRLRSARRCAPDRRSRPSLWAAPTTIVAPDGRHLVEIGDVLDPPAPRGQPELVRLEIARGPVIERERIDRKAGDAALLDQPFGGLRMDAGKMHRAGSPCRRIRALVTCCAQPEFIATQQFSGRRTVLFLPIGEVLARRADSRHCARPWRRRRPPRAARPAARARSSPPSRRVRIVERRIDMGPGMLQHVPPG